ncbi:MAG: globin [Alphaproteobacteria bacterium]|nr:globin [Alphaproteobacteria bacterium]
MDDLIAKSLELAGDRCADPAPLIYARLFARHPDMEHLFWRDTTGSIRGHMLYMALENILDFAGDRSYATNMILAERMNHADLGVPGATFAAFFTAIFETVRELAGADWSPATEAAWQDLLAGLAALGEEETIA